MVKALANLVKSLVCCYPMFGVAPYCCTTCGLRSAHNYSDRHLKNVSSDPTIADVDKQDVMPDRWRRLINLFEVIKATM
jgi:hypothetical protein